MRLLAALESVWVLYALGLGWFSTQARVLPPHQEIEQTISTVDAANPTSTIPSASSTVYSAGSTASQLATAFVSTSATSAAPSASAPMNNDNQDNNHENWPVKHYDLTVTWGQVNSNGELRQAILVNGQTPGPLIEIEEGQQVSIKVTNRLGQPTSLHAHGIIQEGTIWADGVPGVTQYPIQDGASFVYNWTARQYGQYWYHSHYHSQLSDGLRGPILIHPAKHRVNPFPQIGSGDEEVEQLQKAERNPQIVMLSDWSQFTADEINAIYLQSGIDPLCLDSYLINGRGQRICPDISQLSAFASPVAGPLTDKACPLPNSTLSMGTARNFTAQYPDQVPERLYQGCDNTTTPLTVFTADQGDGWVSLNFIGTGGLAEQLVSIDGHSMIVYSADGSYVEPKTIDVLLVSVGSRYSVMVKLDNPGDWTIRTANSQTNQFIGGYAVLSYGSAVSQGCGPPTNGLPGLCGERVFTAPPSSQPKFGFAGNLLSDQTVLLDPLGLAPFPPAPPIATSNRTILWDMSQPNDRVWKIDDEPFLAWRDDQEPAIVDVQSSLDAGVAVSIDNGTVVDIVINVPGGQPTHPFHKHETKFWVIGEGSGPFTWSDVAAAQAAVPDSFNLYNPSYRDTFRSLPSFTGPTWVAIRYQITYPSLTFFHCHISYHLQAGMAVLLAEGLDVGRPQVPDQVLQGKVDVLTQNPSPSYPDGTSVNI